MESSIGAQLLCGAAALLQDLAGVFADEFALFLFAAAGFRFLTRQSADERRRVGSESDRNERRDSEKRKGAGKLAKFVRVHLATITHPPGRARNLDRRERSEVEPAPRWLRRRAFSADQKQARRVT